MNEEQDSTMVELLKGQVDYRGSWTTLRNSLTEYATASGEYKHLVFSNFRIKKRPSETNLYGSRYAL